MLRFRVHSGSLCCRFVGRLRLSGVKRHRDGAITCQCVFEHASGLCVCLVVYDCIALLSCRRNAFLVYEQYVDNECEAGDRARLLASRAAVRDIALVA